VTSVGSLIDEVEAAFGKGTNESRSKALRRITDLFLDGVNAYGEQEIGVFDDVLSGLIEKIERTTLAELSGRIAPLRKAPQRLCAQLSRHDDIEVARPVLSRSPLLSDNLLIEIAESKSQLHLEAIASRPQLSERVSDVLIDRGNGTVLTAVARNFGARLSTRGYKSLLGKAERDVNLASAIVSRPDLSPEMFRKLVAQATSTVQQRLLAATTDPAVKSKLLETLQSVSAVVAREVDRRAEVRNVPAHAIQVDKSRLKSELTAYVEAGKITETVIVLSALTELSGDTIRQLLSQEEPDALLIACKACGLGWTTVRLLLDLAAKAKGTPELNAINYLDQYTKISRDSADRVIRFLKVRKSASVSDMKQMLAS
jgi:uncharacterized protein (DUF2336 family)